MKNCEHCNNKLKDNSRNNSAIFCSKEYKDLYWYVNLQPLWKLENRAKKDKVKNE